MADSSWTKDENCVHSCMGRGLRSTVLEALSARVLCCSGHLTLFNPVDCSPPDSSVHGILQARILECLPCIPPGGLPNAGIKPTSLCLTALAGSFFTASTTWEEALHVSFFTLHVNLKSNY